MTVTTEEAAELAGVEPVTIRTWVLRGDLEPVRRGARPLRFDYDEVARVQREKRSKGWLARHEMAARAWSACAQAEDVQR